MNDSPQTEVIAFLADPATYGPGTDKVAHVHTHVAEVFLAGDRAVKIKRAVRYSFLDFSGIKARRAACEAEVRLNARTAPDIYLGVAAVRRGADGHLSLDEPGRAGPGEPVEWAVVMRRFDERLTLDRLADRGELRADQIDDLIDAVIDLHAAAEACGAPHGGGAALGRLIDENATDMATLPRAFAPDRVAALIAASREALTTAAALLDARRDDGQVRRCHGDLHLGNVVLWQGQPTLFDCIEFSDEIAIIDVLYDLAFLLMDLEVRGLRGFANRALVRYLGRCGHPEALAALPLMLSLRAAVRAKVSAMGIAGQEDRKEADHLAALAERFVAAAESFLAPAPPPRLVAVGGLSGTGKTTLAMAMAPGLGRAPGALVVRSDVLRKRLAGVAPERRLPPESYTPEASERVYQALAREAAAALAAGQSVVADAVFGTEDERALIADVAWTAGVPFQGLWLEAPAATLGERVGARGRDASDATADVVACQLAWDMGEVAWPRIDADAGPEAVLRDARALLAGP